MANYKKMILCGMIFAILLTGCGIGSGITGQYRWAETGGILTLSGDKTWSYEQDDYWGSGNVFWSGTYSKAKDGTYVLESEEDGILQVEKLTDDVIAVYDENGGERDFLRIE